MGSGGWFGDSVGHRDAAVKGAVGRRRRKPGRPVVERRAVRLYPLRDHKTGQLYGYSAKPPRKR